VGGTYFWTGLRSFFVENDMKRHLLSLFCTCESSKRSKIALTTHGGLFWSLLATFYNFGRFMPYLGFRPFLLISLVNKALDERVGEVPLFWPKNP
jgi:hypothetical protein